MSSEIDLSSLTLDELRELRTKVEFLISARGSDDAAGLPFARRVYDAIVYAVGNGPPFEAFIRSNRGRAFSKQLSVIEREVEAWKPKGRAQGVALLRYLFAFVVKDFQARQIPPSVYALATNLPRVPTAVDTQLPGYRENGLLPSAMALLAKKGRHAD